MSEDIDIEVDEVKKMVQEDIIKKAKADEDKEDSEIEGITQKKSEQKFKKDKEKIEGEGKVEVKGKLGGIFQTVWNSMMTERGLDPISDSEKKMLDEAYDELPIGQAKMNPYAAALIVTGIVIVPKILKARMKAQLEGKQGSQVELNNNTSMDASLFTPPSAGIPQRFK